MRQQALYTVGAEHIYEPALARGRNFKAGRDERGPGGSVFKTLPAAQACARRALVRYGVAYGVYIIEWSPDRVVIWHHKGFGELLVDCEIIAKVEG